MSWALSRLHPKDPQLVDAFLLAAGKALYICNSFEGGCRFVLQILRLDRYVALQPGCAWDEAIAAAARDKMLGPSIKELAQFPVISAAQVQTLEKARDARNFIAHEGAMPGFLWATPPVAILEHVEKLRLAVRDVIAGDHLVGRWSYQIEEKQPAGSVMSDYPQLAERWVFEGLLTDVGTSDGVE